MNIVLIAHDPKKKLMQNFCIAYRGILMNHDVYSTATTGRLNPTRDTSPTDQSTSRKNTITVLLRVLVDAKALQPFIRQPKPADHADMIAK